MLLPLWDNSHWYVLIRRQARKHKTTWFGCHDYPVSSGTMSPVLDEMKRVGQLSCAEGIVGGKVRQEYSIIEQGERELAEAKEKIGELVEEVVEAGGPASLPNVDVEEPHSEGNHNEL